MRSIALLKSAIVTASALRRVASSVASLTRLARSAPVKPGVSAAICSGVHVAAELGLLQMHRQDLLAAFLVRPIDQHLAVEAAGAQQGRIEYFRPVGRGEQDQAARRVEPVEFGQQLVQGLLFLVLSAPAKGPRARPSASSSSMKMIAGACLRACSNRSRTRAAPTPTNISTNSEPEIEKNGTPASPATARASSVLPVPGGPTSSTPLGGRPPSRP